MDALPLTREWVQATLPPRPKNAHKGDFGLLHILAGSRHYRGAAVLCASSALRAGAGIVRLVGVEAVCAAVAAALPCCVFAPVPDGLAGGVGPDGLAPALHPMPDGLLAGCGMGASAETALVVQGLLQRAECPLLLDADALNALAGHSDRGDDPARRTAMLALLQKRPHPTVLTPHVGEMARLTGLSTPKVMEAQAEVAARFAAQWGTVVVLKSHATVVAAPDGALYENHSVGNPGLATGGSGDILAGIIASLLAQGITPQKAAACGVWLQGAAADLAAGEYGYAGLSPADLPLALARLLHSMRR